MKVRLVAESAGLICVIDDCPDNALVVDLQDPASIATTTNSQQLPRLSNRVSISAFPRPADNHSVVQTQKKKLIEFSEEIRPSYFQC